MSIWSRSHTDLARLAKSLQERNVQTRKGLAARGHGDWTPPQRNRTCHSDSSLSFSQDEESLRLLSFTAAATLSHQRLNSMGSADSAISPDISHSPKSFNETVLCSETPMRNETTVSLHESGERSSESNQSAETKASSENKECNSESHVQQEIRPRSIKNVEIDSESRVQQDIKSQVVDKRDSDVESHAPVKRTAFSFETEDCSVDNLREKVTNVPCGENLGTNEILSSNIQGTQKSTKDDGNVCAQTELDLSVRENILCEELSFNSNFKVASSPPLLVITDFSNESFNSNTESANAIVTSHSLQRGFCPPHLSVVEHAELQDTPTQQLVCAVQSVSQPVSVPQTDLPEHYGGVASPHSIALHVPPPGEEFLENSALVTTESLSSSPPMPLHKGSELNLLLLSLVSKHKDEQRSLGNGIHKSGPLIISSIENEHVARGDHNALRKFEENVNIENETVLSEVNSPLDNGRTSPIKYPYFDNKIHMGCPDDSSSFMKQGAHSLSSLNGLTGSPERGEDKASKQMVHVSATHGRDSPRASTGEYQCEPHPVLCSSGETLKIADGPIAGLLSSPNIVMSKPPDVELTVSTRCLSDTPTEVPTTSPREDNSNQSNLSRVNAAVHFENKDLSIGQCGDANLQSPSCGNTGSNTPKSLELFDTSETRLEGSDVQPCRYAGTGQLVENLADPEQQPVTDANPVSFMGSGLWFVTDKRPIGARSLSNGEDIVTQALPHVDQEVHRDCKEECPRNGESLTFSTPTKRFSDPNHLAISGFPLPFDSEQCLQETTSHEPKDKHQTQTVGTFSDIATFSLIISQGTPSLGIENSPPDVNSLTSEAVNRACTCCTFSTGTRMSTSREITTQVDTAITVSQVPLQPSIMKIGDHRHGEVTEPNMAGSPCNVSPQSVSHVSQHTLVSSPVRVFHYVPHAKSPEREIPSSRFQHQREVTGDDNTCGAPVSVFRHPPTYSDVSGSCAPNSDKSENKITENWPKPSNSPSAGDSVQGNNHCMVNKTVSDVNRDTDVLRDKRTFCVDVDQPPLTTVERGTHSAPENAFDNIVSREHQTLKNMFKNVSVPCQHCMEHQSTTSTENLHSVSLDSSSMSSSNSDVASVHSSSFETHVGEMQERVFGLLSGAEFDVDTDKENTEKGFASTIHRGGNNKLPSQHGTRTFTEEGKQLFPSHLLIPKSPSDCSKETSTALLDVLNAISVLKVKSCNQDLPSWSRNELKSILHMLHSSQNVLFRNPSNELKSIKKDLRKLSSSLKRRLLKSKDLLSQDLQDRIDIFEVRRGSFWAKNVSSENNNYDRCEISASSDEDPQVMHLQDVCCARHNGSGQHSVLSSNFPKCDRKTFKKNSGGPAQRVDTNLKTGSRCISKPSAQKRITSVKEFRKLSGKSERTSGSGSMIQVPSKASAFQRQNPYAKMHQFMCEESEMKSYHDVTLATKVVCSTDICVASLSPELSVSPTNTCPPTSSPVLTITNTSRYSDFVTLGLPSFQSEPPDSAQGAPGRGAGSHCTDSLLVSGQSLPGTTSGLSGQGSVNVETSQLLPSTPELLASAARADMENDGERGFRMDREFDKYLADMKPFVLKLPQRTERQKCAVWIKKLCEPPGGGTSVRKIRNTYAQLMLQMLKKGSLSSPFDHKPEEGALRPLPPYMSIYLDDPVSADFHQTEHLPDWVEGELGESVGSASLGKALGNPAATSTWVSSVGDFRDRPHSSMGHTLDKDPSLSPIRQTEFPRTRGYSAVGLWDWTFQCDTGNDTDWSKPFSSSVTSNFSLPKGTTFYDEPSYSKPSDREVALRTKMIEAKFHEEKLKLQQKHDAAVQKILDRKNTEIEDVKNHYRAKSKEMEDTIAKLERKVQALIKETEYITENKDKQIAELKKMTDESNETRRSEFEKRLHDVMAEFEQEKYDLQKQHTQNIQEILDDTNSRLQRMEAEYSQQTTSTTNVIKELESRVQQLMNEVDSTLSQRSAVEKERNETQMRLERLTGEHERLKEKMGQQEREYQVAVETHEHELRTLKNKTEASLEFLKQEHTMAASKSADSISELEEKVDQLKKSLKDSEDHRHRQIRELEQGQQQDKVHVENLHDKQIRNMKKEMEQLDTDWSKKLTKMEQNLKEKEQELSKVKEEKQKQAQQSEQALEEFKSQVEKNQVKIYDDMKQQMEQVETDLTKSKQAREKQAKEFSRQLEDDRYKHQHEIAEMKMSLEGEKSQMLRELHVQKEYLLAEHDKDMDNLKDLHRAEVLALEARLKERQDRAEKASNDSERLIRELREELVQANQLRKQQLVELGLLREEEKQKMHRDHEAEFARIRTENEQQRLELQKSHNTEMETVLEKTNERLKTIEKDYADRGNKSAESVAELQSVVAQLRGDIKRSKESSDEKLSELKRQYDEEKQTLRKQYSHNLTAIQRELENQRNKAQAADRNLLKKESEFEERVTVLKFEFEEKVRGLMPTELKQELEDTIASLQSQVTSLQQRATMLQEELDLRNKTSLGPFGSQTSSPIKSAV
ncbi:uncharacterized protein LOC101862025 isoform X2 [Aplysia californica]|uniref:Uncharacterized protein LOC101862025 isoform X2 n=1 Tax=Aplysia californica TaxID=6500 RepID=A0ABM1VRD9_APLCA|nr:uncharacterized protein LOC101862025 isoform X2 [Aplysia californica]